MVGEMKGGERRVEQCAAGLVGFQPPSRYLKCDQKSIIPPRYRRD